MKAGEDGSPIGSGSGSPDVKRQVHGKRPSGKPLPVTRIECCSAPAVRGRRRESPSIGPWTAPGFIAADLLFVRRISMDDNNYRYVSETGGLKHTYIACDPTRAPDSQRRPGIVKEAVPTSEIFDSFPHHHLHELDKLI
ncbi:hypothetical protein PSHT_07545 [Puccinia striiformis]|uniref:Uncharacterized protein n=2 Tax=Puccinia striiformis TaxID=27350 RepID=A0A0L0VRH0_9BASI|nr:hypothetical protein PSTG_04931 [Puccinia striiformis f. sp. tritici PST-78]POW14078.1 hypothetical protein PSHT_07545 [Puccinia striiformis]